MVPHALKEATPLRAWNFSSSSEKRVFQQYWPIAGIDAIRLSGRLLAYIGHRCANGRVVHRAAVRGGRAINRARPARPPENESKLEVSFPAN